MYLYDTSFTPPAPVLFARFRFRRLEVVALDAPHVLLGRDVLNNFRLTLDGPGLIFGFQV